MSIKNVIFDFGQVLVHFEPSYMVGVYVEDAEDKALLEKVVFDRLYWDRLDKGTISNEETMSLIKARLPERLWDVADKIYYNWVYNIPEIDGMSELLSHLKSKHGVRLFLLSNISNYFAIHSPEIPILKKLDGLVMSAPIGIVKPSREIFEHICKKYDITPSEAIFVDDRIENIEGAIAYGIQGYVFDGDSEKLKKYLDKILSK
ncbi:MAG: HAD family phosphatase [Clostridia bacterium]|nr:HAD family phosphatase [Clostridia bacterium]